MLLSFSQMKIFFFRMRKKETK